MGNKILRPSQLDPLSGFNDDQLGYLRDKFELLSDQNKLLSLAKIEEHLQTSSEQAIKILNYIDFEGHQSVDFYEFVCAAASLHQNDREARQFIFDIYASAEEMDEDCFIQFYSTVFRYLKYLNIAGVKAQDYSKEIGVAKFKQYDYNHNGKISLDQFQSMLRNDFHCKLWMETLGFAAESPPEVHEKILNQEIIQEDQFKTVEEKGEQFQATNAWTKVCEQMNPGDQTTENKAPNINLDIGYIYGYRSYDTRNNLKYNSQGEAVYHTAACGIVLNKSKNTMRVNTSHFDDITCLDVNLSKGIAATGELGRWPSLIIWDINTLETKAIFAKKLERSINNVAISKSGKYVAATSMSDKHEIAVYDIEKNSLVAFGGGPRSVIYALKFTLAEDELVCACAKEVVFVQFLDGKIQSKKGAFGKAPLNPSLSIATLGDSIVTSMSNGLLILWKGNFASKVFKEHTKSVGALCQRSEGGIISGDAIGKIIIWSNTMNKERQISLQTLLGNVKSNNIRLIALCQQNGNILAGTRGGQIIEVQKGNSAAIIMEGHFDQQLWGLCVSFNKSEFFTGGGDKLLIKWDAVKRKAIGKKKMEGSIVALDLSKQNLLAVGLKCGIVNLMDGGSLSLVKNIVNHKNPDKDVLSTVKFSPDGSQLAVGYCPPLSLVYLYDVANKFKKVGECKGASTRIVSVDFSVGGDLILTTSIEPLFYKTPTCAQTFAKSVKGEPWATMNSKYTWFTQGIWPPCSDGSDINFVDRSNDKKFLATADDFSLVKIFRYPVCNKRQIATEHKGHSSHVTAVKWSFDDKMLISTGGLQKSIIQWNVNKGEDYSYDVDEQQQEQEVEEQELEEKAEKKKGEEDNDEFNVVEEQGEQALSIKPFEGQVKASTPSNFRVNHKGQIPDQELRIKHAWGVRNLYINDQVRNQVKYSANGSSCFFITAALGVEMDIKTKKQTFYSGQSQDLICFDMSKDKKLCATGQMAQLNAAKATKKIVDVHVWDADEKKLVAKLSDFHQRAVVLVLFSPSGKYLLTVGQDDKNSLAVYDLKSKTIAWKSTVDGAKVNAAAWKSDTQYITVGHKHAKMWTQSKGVMGKLSCKWDPQVSVIYWNDKYVSGGKSGSIFVWSGNVGNSNKCHEGAVDCLAVDSKGILYSGCSKGRIMTWKLSGTKLVPQSNSWDVNKFDDIDSGVLSIDFNKDNMLLCTRSSSIYQLKLSQKNPSAKPLTTGHCKGQLWAEAWSSNKQRFVTGGDDCTVRLWQASSFDQLKLFKLKEKIRGLDWHQKQKGCIVVGDYRGNIHLFDSQLEQLDHATTKFGQTPPNKEPFWIQDIKFSPDGKWVAFGAHGGPSKVEIYSVEGDKFGARKIVNAGLTSALLSVDWSQDSSIMAVVSQAYQLKFLNVSNPVSASTVKDVKWASWSAKFGYAVQYIHQDSNYSHLNCVAVSPSQSLVVTGSDDQKIRIFKYPVGIPKQKSRQYTGHSSHITRALFSRNQKNLLSVGGNDRTIILWDVIGGAEMQEQVYEEEEENKQAEEEVDQEDEGQPEENKKKIDNDDDVDDIPRIKPEPVKLEKEKDADDFYQEQDAGDQFMAVKPYIGAIKEPSTPYYKGSGKAPNAELTLAYAHGYRTKDCRNNLKYLSQNQLSYHTAGLGIILNINDDPHTQTFFDKHKDDIISMAWSEDKQSMFTGEMGAKPTIYMWDKKGQKQNSFTGTKKGVSALGVNENYLVASGLDDDHYVYVFDIKKGGAPIASEKGGRQVILGLKWVNDTSFVSVGLKHYKLWQLKQKSVKGSIGSFGKNSNLLCSVEVDKETVFTGASDGSLLVWSGKSVTKSKKNLHSGAINALCIHENVLLTGANDETIKLLALGSLEELAVINCAALLEQSVCAKIKAIDVHNNKIAVGTLGSQIYQIQCSDNIKSVKKQSKFKLLSKNMSGHYAPNYVTNEVWGLAFLSENEYVTCSDDGTVRIWDLQKNQQISWGDLKFNEELKPLKLTPKEKFLPDSVHGRCLAVSEEGSIVIGCKDGTVKIVDSDLKPQWCKKICKKEISHIKFSPDGSVLAIGAHDGRIYLYEWEEGSEPTPKKGKPIKHTSYIKHFDFSRDSNWIHSTCGSYELLFWQVNTGTLMTASTTKDEEWATWNVTFGWPVQGIWEPFMDGTDINAVDRSNSSYAKNMKLLASGDDHGKVRLLEYPCLVKNSKAVYGDGHSSHVTNVKFSQDDKILISTGGEDQTIIVWKVEVKG